LSDLIAPATKNKGESMNGKVAKKLRKKLDYKPYAKRRYSVVDGTKSNIGKRQEYQDAKKDYKTA
jgi:hypothetical protein